MVQLDDRHAPGRVLGAERVLARHIEHGVVRMSVRADGEHLAITDDRVVVADEDGVVLDVAISDVRSVQLGLAEARPACLALVPKTRAPLMISVLPDALDDVARAVAYIASRLAAASGTG